MVNATVGHELFSFMDAYSSYNQIQMFHRDEEHTVFITDRGLYCYKFMPFGLKNAGATYQRLVNKIFAELLGVLMEVYNAPRSNFLPPSADQLDAQSEQMHLYG